MNTIPNQQHNDTVLYGPVGTGSFVFCHHRSSMGLRFPSVVIYIFGYGSRHVQMLSNRLTDSSMLVLSLFMLCCDSDMTAVELHNEQRHRFDFLHDTQKQEYCGRLQGRQWPTVFQGRSRYP